MEKVEVVVHQLKLKDGLFGSHRRNVELLGLYDPRRCRSFGLGVDLWDACVDKYLLVTACVPAAD